MVTTGGVLTIGTKTEAQGYAPDWPALEGYFPEIRGIASYTEKWAYIQARCQEVLVKTPERFLEWLWRKIRRRLQPTHYLYNHIANAEFVKAHRPKIVDSHRVIIDKVVTTAFVTFVVDQLQAETSEFGDFKFHQCELGTTAENVTDTGIETDTGITPVAGTQTETDFDTYKSVATMTMDATEAITEHVLMSQSGAGTCMDRTKFSAINVVSGNQIEFTFEISFAAGS